MSHRPDPLRPSRYGELSTLERAHVDQLVNAIASHAGTAPLLTLEAHLQDLHGHCVAKLTTNAKPKPGPKYAEALADWLAEAIRTEWLLEPDRYRFCATWSELHDVCDANEFLIEAAEAAGLEPAPGFDNPAEVWQREMEHAAIDLLNTPRRWPIPNPKG